jgi:hypothetical protein
MKALILAFAAFVTLVGTFETSAKTQGSVKVFLGKTTSVDRGRVKVKFLSVVEDSRCPVNATCVWAGNAKIKISVSRGKSDPIELELNTLTEPRKQILYGYEFVLKDLEPQKGRPGPKSSSTAILSIARK